MDYQDEINLINFFTRNKCLTRAQQARFATLVARDLEDDYQPVIPKRSTIEELLTIWEEEGLDVAVQKWKEILQEPSDKILIESDKIAFTRDALHFVHPKKKMNIDKTDMSAIDTIKFEQKAIKMDATNNSGLPYDLFGDDITFMNSENL